MRPPTLAHRPYAPVSTDAEYREPAQYQRHRTADKQNNYKPTPLRIAFLVSSIALFLVCIALSEILLRNTVTADSPKYATSTSASASSVQIHQPRHIAEVKRTSYRGPTTYICSEGQPTPTQVIADVQPRASLCSEWSETYAPYTKNLSYPMQTSMEQFLMKYSSASEDGWMSGWKSDCPTWPVFGTFYRTIDIICTLTTIVQDYNGCWAGGTYWISNFALTSTYYEVCGVSMTAVIDEDDTPTTSAVSQDDVIDTEATPTDPLPTVTKPAEEPAVTPADVPVAATPAPTNPAEPVTYVQDAPQPAVATPTVETVVVAAAPVPVTLSVTDEQGQAQTIVTQADAVAAGSSATFVVTNSQGSVATLTTQVAAAAAALATIVTTNSQGIPQTVVVPANQLVATTSTYVVTNAQGQAETSTTVIYAISGSFSTYTTTNSAGQVETAISKMADSDAKYTTTTQYTSLVTTTNADGSVSSFSAVVVETVVRTGTPTVTSVVTSTTGASATGFVLASHERIVDVEYSKFTYILAMYLPALIAVIIKAMWEMVFAAIKLIEPFERMCTAASTDAQYSIFAQYLSSSFSWDAFGSLSHGNPLPLLSGFLYIIVQIFTPLAAASMTIRARATCDRNGSQVRCLPTWIVNTTFMRGVQVTMGICAVIVLLVLWYTRRRRSGIPSDPSSLASVAALMTHEPLVYDMQKVDPNTDHSNFEEQFAQHRFLLDYHTNSIGQHTYGVIGLKSKNLRDDHDHGFAELDSAINDTAYGRNITRNKHNYSTIHHHENNYPSSYATTSFTSRIRKHLAADVSGLAFPLALLAIVLTFYFDNSDTVFNRFFNSGGALPKFVLVAIATLSSLHLSHVERLVRIAEPFRRLSGNAPSARGKSVPPETTVLITRSGTPYSTLPTNLHLLFSHLFKGGGSGMIFQTLMSLTVVLADLNILAVAGVAYSDAMTWASYQVSCKVTIILTAWIVLMYIVHVVWWRRTAAIQYLGGRSISKGVGTVGGVMRWLVSGGEQVPGAVVRIREESGFLGAWSEKGNYYGQENGGGRTKVWFGRTGEIGLDGRERWALMCDVPALRQRQRQRHFQDEDQQEDYWRRHSVVSEVSTVSGMTVNEPRWRPQHGEHWF